MDNFSLDSLPSIAFNKRDELPARSAVYFALSQTNEILYIGKATHLDLRWRNHHRISDLEHLDCATIAWLECEKGELKSIEKFMIDKFQPPINNMKKPRKARKITFSLVAPKEVIDELDALTKYPNSFFANRSHAFVCIFHEWKQFKQNISN